MTNDEKKEWAQLLFVHQRMTQKEIAAKVGVSEVTLSKWANGGNWAKLKTSLVMTKQESLARLYNQLSELNDAIEQREEGHRFANSREADVIAKYAAAIKSLESEISIAEVVNVFMAFNEFARKVAPIAEVQQIVSLQDSFIRNKTAQ